MRCIDHWIEEMEDEIDGAEEYAERYIKEKAKGNHSRAARYRSMAEDELSHASAIREMATQDIEEIRKVHTIPVEDEEKWNLAHKMAVEHHAVIKRMIE